MEGQIWHPGYFLKYISEGLIIVPFNFSFPSIIAEIFSTSCVYVCVVYETVSV